MIYVAQAQAFEAVYESGQTGFVGTVEVAIVDNDGNTVVGPTTTNITETSVGGNPTGVYTWNAPAAPASTGQYTIIWSLDGSYDPITTSAEDLIVITPDSGGTLPPIPPPVDGGVAFGPCTSWTTSAETALCCDVAIGTETSVLDDYVASASQILFELSGRLYSGLCEKTVRPCRTGCTCGIQVLSRGYVIEPWIWAGASWTCDGNPCGCSPLSEVLLSGYPVREITEVKIDGDIVDPATYRLDGHRHLVRVRDPADPDTPLAWPACQLLDLPDTEDGTFSVTYTYGQNPPLIGAQAAATLACQLYNACSGGIGDCEIPANAVRVTRQGVTIDKSATIAWFYGKNTDRGWATGIPAVDAFLNSVTTGGMRQRPRTWSPDGWRYAKTVGS